MKKQDIITMIDLHCAWFLEQPNIQTDVKVNSTIYLKNVPVDVIKEVSEELDLKLELETIGSYLTCTVDCGLRNSIVLMSQEVVTTTSWRVK